MKQNFGFRIPLVWLALALLIPRPALADQAAIQHANDLVWVSAGALDYNYKEPSAAPVLPDSERGWIPSGQLGVSYMTPTEQYVSLDSSLSYGDAKYRGAFFFFPTVPLNGTTRETISETNFRIGQGFPVGQNVMLMPYGEFGYRYWNRELSSAEHERYSNYDALGGLRVDITPTPKTLLSAFASGGGTLAPKMHTAGETFELGHAAEYKFGGKLGYDVTPKWQVFTTADYTYFHYEHSGVVDGAFEPNSNTGETAVRVGLGYKFR